MTLFNIPTTRFWSRSVKGALLHSICIIYITKLKGGGGMVVPNFAWRNLNVFDFLVLYNIRCIRSEQKLINGKVKYFFIIWTLNINLGSHIVLLYGSMWQVNKMNRHLSNNTLSYEVFYFTFKKKTKRYPNYLK